MDEQQEHLSENEEVQDTAVDEKPAAAADAMTEQSTTRQGEEQESAVAQAEDATGGTERITEPCATERFDQVLARLDSIDQLIAQRLQYDDVKEKVIDRQHAELAELREGLKRDLMRPVLYDLAQTDRKSVV